MRSAFVMATAAALIGVTLFGSVARADDDDDEDGWHNGGGWHHGWDQGRGNPHRGWGDAPRYGAYDSYGYQRCYVTRQRVFDDWGYPRWERVRVCR